MFLLGTCRRALTANQPNPRPIMDRSTWSHRLTIIATRGRIQARPAPPSSWPPCSVHCLFLSPSLHPLPPSSNPPICVRQADHLTTNATATGPSPSNVKPGWNVAPTTQTHGKEEECGSSKKGGGGGRWEVGGRTDRGSNWCPSDEEHASLKLKRREGWIREL